MNNFLRKNKIVVALIAVLVIFTVLLCIPATIKVFAGVFGYAVYFYLALGYGYLVLRLLKKKLPIKGKRLALIIATVASALMTLHIGICGAETVNSGFGGYVGGSYEKATVAGVVFSLISCPVALPCKFIASVIIFFLLTAILGFFVIYPYIFESAKHGRGGNATRSEKKERISAEQAPPRLHVEPEPEKDAFEKAEPEKEINILPEEEPAPDSREAALKMLFGASYKEKLKMSDNSRQAQPERTEEERLSFSSRPNPAPFNEAHKTSKYNIVDGIDAPLLPPDDSLYTNNYLADRRKEAEKTLYTISSDEDYRRRYGIRTDETKTVGEEIGETIKVNPYIPSKVVYEAEPKKEPIKPETIPEPEMSVRPEPLYEQTSATEYSPQETAESEEELFPKATESAFMNALRQSGKDAPENVEIAPLKAPVQEKVHLKEQPETEFVAPPTPVVKKPAPRPAPVEAPAPVAPPKVIRPYSAPPIKVFEDHIKSGFSPYVENYQELKEVFEEKLKNYNIDVKLIDVIKGPTITRCILDLSEKCPISKVTSAQQDISRLLKTDSILIEKQIKGSTYFAVEVPNETRGIVSFKEVIASPEYANAKGGVVVALGKTNDGRIVIEDIAEMPHALIAGSTGSGKSICINVILASIFYKYSPDDVKLVLVDLKFVEMANFGGLPHLLFKEPLNDIQEVINAVKWLKEETFRRYNVFKEARVRSFVEYNAKVIKDGQPENKLPRIVLIIDEASELMTCANGKTVEALLSTLARIARAAGIHMLFATQNPVREVITGEIQNNLNTKIAFSVSDRVHSQIILKENGAENLLGKGDMLIKKGSDMQRAQCAFVSTEEIENMVAFIKDNNDCDFDEDMIERILHGSKEEIPAAPVEAPKTSFIPEKKNFDDNQEFQALVKEALRIFVETEKVSATLIQRRFSKGYGTIANMMDYMEEKGYISATVNNKRQLLISKEDFLKLYPDDNEANLGE